MAKVHRKRGWMVCPVCAGTGRIPKENQCIACGKPFELNHYVYQVKLDDGAIALSHGYPCTDAVAEMIKRPAPIEKPDWWIRRLYVTARDYFK